MSRSNADTWNRRTIAEDRMINMIDRQRRKAVGRTLTIDEQEMLELDQLASVVRHPKKVIRQVAQTVQQITIKHNNRKIRKKKRR